VMLINHLALLISEGLFRHFSLRVVNIPVSQYFFPYHTNVIEFAVYTLSFSILIILLCFYIATWNF